MAKKKFKIKKKKRKEEMSHILPMVLVYTSRSKEMQSVRGFGRERSFSKEFCLDLSLEDEHGCVLVRRRPQGMSHKGKSRRNAWGLEWARWGLGQSGDLPEWSHSHVY